jgi:hypothetical protein
MFPKMRFIMPFKTTRSALLSNTCPTVTDVFAMAVFGAYTQRLRSAR